MQTDNGLWWDENDPPDWIVDTPFADVAIGFGLEKATITVAGKTFRLQLEGCNRGDADGRLLTYQIPTAGALLGIIWESFPYGFSAGESTD